MCEPSHACGDHIHSQPFRFIERAAMNVCSPGSAMAMEP